MENRDIPTIFDQPKGCGQTLPREVEGAIELGCVRPDLLTPDQVHMVAYFAKTRLDAERPKPVELRAA